MSRESLGAVSAVLGIVLLVSVGQEASAQFTTDFEDPPYVAGMDLNGQDEFYLPPAGGISAGVHAYAGNAFGFPDNPTGGDQFAGGTGPGTAFVRSQRDIVYGDGTGDWSACFDIAAKYLGTLPAAQNIGSFSTQTFPGQKTFIALARWTDTATAANWNADYVWFDAAGTQLTEQVPDADFQNLMTNHWYRWCTDFNLDTSLITEVSLTDLTTGVTVTHNPADRYLFGGTGGAPDPTGFRLFVGSTVPGNTLGFDNVGIVPEPGTAVLLILALAPALRRRPERNRFISE